MAAARDLPSLSSLRFPSGVSYVSHFDSAHPARWKACDGPRMNTRELHESASHQISYFGEESKHSHSISRYALVRPCGCTTGIKVTGVARCTTQERKGNSSVRSLRSDDRFAPCDGWREIVFISWLNASQPVRELGIEDVTYSLIEDMCLSDLVGETNHPLNTTTWQQTRLVCGTC